MLAYLAAFPLQERRLFFYQEKFLIFLAKVWRRRNTGALPTSNLGAPMEFSVILEKAFSILAIVAVLGAFFFLQKIGITSGG